MPCTVYKPVCLKSQIRKSSKKNMTTNVIFIYKIKVIIIICQSGPHHVCGGATTVEELKNKFEISFNIC